MIAPLLAALGFCLLHLAAHALRRIHLLKWKQLVQENPKRFRWVSASAGTPDLLVSILDLMRTLMLGAAILLCVSRFGVTVTIQTGLVLLALCYCMSELLLAGERAHSAIIILFPVIRIVVLPIYPLLRLVIRRRDEGDPDEDPTDAEVSAYLNLGKEEGVIEDSEEELFQSLVDFSDTLVREVMTPRTDMVVIRPGDEWDGLLRLFLSSRHSRIPVVGENMDDIVGILHVKDCLKIVVEGEQDGWRNEARPPWFVPETKRLLDLLTEMRETRQQMAVVVDEYGGTAGLVTMEDLLEEIVGDITDEDEPEDDEVRAVSSGVFSLDGKAHVDLLQDLFGVTVEDDGFDTIGGLLATHMGRVPTQGSRLTVAGLLFEVREADKRRVRRVEVRRAPGESRDDAE